PPARGSFDTGWRLRRGKWLINGEDDGQQDYTAKICWDECGNGSDTASGRVGQNLRSRLIDNAEPGYEFRLEVGRRSLGQSTRLRRDAPDWRKHLGLAA